MLEHAVVYLARDRLPPVAVHAESASASVTAEARIRSRLVALFSAQATSGLFNAALSSRARPERVRVDGDLATVDFAVPGGDWGVAGSTGVRAFIQQLVFTATEEPGIRRVLLTENGAQAVIGGEGVVIDHPVTREDVTGYRANAMNESLTWRTEPRPPVTVTSHISVDEVAPGVARFVIDTGLRGADAKASLGFTARVMRNDERAFPDLGKWVLAVSVPDARTSDDPFRAVGRTPVVAVGATSTASAVRYDIGLADQRPWRVAMLYEPLRVVVDIGGDPDAVSANIALYQPPFGARVRQGGLVSGMIRAFEARYEYRITDASGRVLVDEFATASLGTAEMWGSFSLPLPPLPTGNVSLEILLRSPKDGEVSESVFTSLAVVP